MPLKEFNDGAVAKVCTVVEMTYGIQLTKQVLEDGFQYSFLTEKDIFALHRKNKPIEFDFYISDWSCSITNRSGYINIEPYEVDSVEQLVGEIEYYMIQYLTPRVRKYLRNLKIKSLLSDKK